MIKLWVSLDFGFNAQVVSYQVDVLPSIKHNTTGMLILCPPTYFNGNLINLIIKYIKHFHFNAIDFDYNFAGLDKCERLLFVYAF